MRLVTRSDFDGLVCGALLKEAGIIDHWKFAHPKDLQDGLVEVTEDDCLANVPYVEGCGLWFDHHSSEMERNQLAGKYKGESRLTPSCARIIYDYYGGQERFSHFDEMMEAVDKVDSAVQNLFGILKYFNIFTYIHLSDLYTNYLNADLFGYPAGIRRISQAALLPLGLACVVWGAVLSCIQKPAGGKSGLVRLAWLWNSVKDRG